MIIFDTIMRVLGAAAISWTIVLLTLVFSFSALDLVIEDTSDKESK
jgi:hypothetical protein